MYSVVHTAVLSGIDACLVSVEADISNGMPMFEMVGLLASEVRESKERVRTALKNCQYELPIKRITVNLAPANIRKSGSGFDLPVAVAVLAAMEVFPTDILEDMFFAGEISLEGRIIGINGVLPMVICAKEAGLKTCIVAKENVKEASLVPGMQVIGLSHLQEVLACLRGDAEVSVDKEENKEEIKKETMEKAYDFAQIHGQRLLKRACEVAISGMHNMLMVGPGRQDHDRQMHPDHPAAHESGRTIRSIQDLQCVWCPKGDGSADTKTPFPQSPSYDHGTGADRWRQYGASGGDLFSAWRCPFFR